MNSLKLIMSTTLLGCGLAWVGMAQAEPATAQHSQAKTVMGAGSSASKQASATEGVPASMPAREFTRVNMRPAAKLTMERLAAMGCQLPALTFSQGSWQLTTSIKANLASVAACMGEHPELRLWVFGLAGDISSPSTEWVLGFKRAEAVVEYLVSKGVYRGRLVPASEAPEAGVREGVVVFDVATEPSLDRALESQSVRI